MQPAGRDATVAVVRCNGYDREEVDVAVGRAVALIGGLERFVAPGDAILLKPNLLQGREPERCVTTHPAVLAAVARLLVEHGCRVTIADSPGGGIVYNEANLRRVYRGGRGDWCRPELRCRLPDRLIPGGRGDEAVLHHRPGGRGRCYRGRLKGKDPHVDPDAGRHKKPLRDHPGT